MPNKSTPSPDSIAKIIRQLWINPESAEGTDGGHVGDCLISLFTEACWPSRSAEVN